MDFTTMTLDELEARMKEIRSIIEANENPDIEALEKEIKAIEERKAVLKEEAVKAIEERAKVALDDSLPVIETFKEDTKMSEVEIRNSLEYGKAFVKAMLSGDDTEARALLSTNVSGGQIPVPQTLNDAISNAWENAQIMSLVKKANVTGIYKSAFELSATGAVVHVEGSAAPNEEVVTLGVVTIAPQSIKKWITISDEAIENTTIDTLGYIYAEIAQRIAEKAEDILVGAIVNASTTASATAVSVPVLSVAALAKDTIVNAVALLCGQARNLHIAMNRQTYAAFQSLALGASYAVDVFDGLKDRIVFTDVLPAVQSATSGDTVVIVGDFSGAVANFPNGQEMTIKTDELSLAEKDLVKVVGRQYVGIGLVADKRFVKVALS